jgi:hypothetical protein
LRITTTEKSYYCYKDLLFLLRENLLMFQKYTSRYSDNLYLTLLLFFTCLLILTICLCTCSGVVDYTSLPPGKGTTHTTVSLRENNAALGDPQGDTLHNSIFYHQFVLRDVSRHDPLVAFAQTTGPSSEISAVKGTLTSSQCVACHTDVKRLIRLGWEIEKIRPKKGRSAETSGEG